MKARVERKRNVKRSDVHKGTVPVIVSLTFVGQSKVPFCRYTGFRFALVTPPSEHNPTSRSVPSEKDIDCQKKLKINDGDVL